MDVGIGQTPEVNTQGGTAYKLHPSLGCYNWEDERHWNSHQLLTPTSHPHRALSLTYSTFHPPTYWVIKYTHVHVHTVVHEESQLANTQIGLDVMNEVTQCAVSTNARSHQLCWGDREWVYYVSCVRNTVVWP